MSTTPAVDADATLAARSPLETLVELGVLEPFDRRFADLLARLDPAAEASALAAAAVALAARERGHVCVDLDDGAQRRLLAPSAESRSALDAALDGATAALARATFVRPSGSSAETPLVLEGRRLYLDRLHLAEEALVGAIRQRLQAPAPLAMEPAALGAAIRRLFGRSGEAPFTDQMRATLLAVRSRFAIVTGGPGTGKTTTVVRILALLLENDPDLRVRLLAPTGKAAARLSESIRAQLETLDSPLRGAIPSDASTVHRALGIRAERPSQARYDQRRPLPCDVLVVDEASMVDFELMARLFSAVAPETRIVLLGDRDQLASVEAGSVLGDLCGPPGQPVLASPQLAVSLAGVCPWPTDRIATTRVPAISDAVVMLEGSHRFEADRGVGKLAAAVRVGDAKGAREALAADEVRHVAADDEAASAALRHRVVSAFAELSRERDPVRVLRLLDRLRVLCAVRRGPDGVEAWNETIASGLVSRGLVPRGRQHYHGRPILVTVNDYDVQLYNGDVGVELEIDGVLRACFPDARADHGHRAISPARLPAHETVYAMTIHKSQGSEVDEVVLVLPREESRVLGRELVYTGITRARRDVTLVGPWSTLERALTTTVTRASGLREKLWR